MTKKTLRTWILVADAGRARVLEWSGADAPLRPADRGELVADAVHGHARDLKSDRPGRTQAGAGGARSSMEPHQDPHIVEKHRFAKRVAAMLEEAARGGAFERLVLVAPPKMLKDLRADLPAATARLIAGELAKDLVKTPLAELAGHVRGLLERRDGA
jgi:protein required for attachment to host cells